MALPVLFMIQHLNRGGTEDHFHDLVTGLDRTLIEPHVIHFNDLNGNIALKLAAHSWLPKTFIPVRRAYDRSGLKAIGQVRSYIRRNKIAGVVTFHFVADFIGTLAALGTPTRVISSRRDMGFTRTSRQFQVGRWLRHGVDGYIAVSDAVRQAVARDEHVPANKMEVIYNGIDLAELEAQRWDLATERARHGIAPDELIIGCIANFNPVKGHLNLIDAFSRMRTQCPDLPMRLLLAGDGPLRQAIQTRIATLRLGSSVALVGSSQAVAREFQLSDIVVLPSETEGFSNSLVQAMAFRKPVVACRVGGNPEAINDGESGLLVEPKDPLALAQALSRLARDPALRQSMGEAGRQRAVTHFSKHAMLQQTQQLLLRIAARRSR